MDGKVVITEYLKEANESSLRVRKLIFFMLFTVIFAFIAFWNSRDKGWISKRYEAITEAYEHFVDTTAGRNVTRLGALPFPHHTYSKENEAGITRFLQERNLNTATKITDIKETFARLAEDTYKVKIPILGISFDINDLGIFSGITFMFIMLMLWFSLEREMDNLEIAFDRGVKENMMKDVYEYLTMSQVITLPRRIVNKVETLPRFWKLIPKCLLFFPFIVLLLISVNDVITFSKGSSLNSASSIIQVIVECLMTAVVFIQTLLSARCSKEIDKLWDESFRNITKE